MRNLTKKIIDIIVLRSWFIVFILIGVFAGISMMFSANSNTDTAVVPVKKIEKFVLDNPSVQGKSIVVSGSIRPIDGAVLLSKLPGSIIKFNINAGDFVKKGDVIAEIEHSTLGSGLSVALAEYYSAKAQYSQQVALRESRRKQAQIGLKKAQVFDVSSKNTVVNNLEYSYKSAYDIAQQSLNDAIMALVVLSDERSRWQGKDSSGEISMATNSLIKSSGVLLGADGTSALWSSGYLIKLNGGTRKVMQEMKRDKINKVVFDGALSGIASGLGSVKKGLGYVRAVVALRGTKSELKSIEAKMTQINSTIINLTRAQQIISQAKILFDANINKQKVVIKQAKQTLDDSISGYETAENSAKMAVESAKQRVLYAKARLADAFIRAPFDGIVIDKFASLGESVAPGTKIVSIASSSGWKAVFSAADVFNGLIKKGDTVKVSINGVGGEFTASVTRVIPSTELYSRRIRFEVNMPKLPDSVRSGMVATARISSNNIFNGDKKKITKNTIFLVPNKFVGYDYNGAYVVVDNMRVPVTIFLRQVNNSLITSKSLKVGIVIKNPLS